MVLTGGINAYIVLRCGEEKSGVHTESVAPLTLGYIKPQKIATLKDEHLSYTSLAPAGSSQLSCPQTDLRPVFQMFTAL